MSGLGTEARTRAAQGVPTGGPSNVSTCWSFPWSFRQAQHRTTGPHRLDQAPDLTSENGTLRDGMDGRGSTSNPATGGLVRRDRWVRRLPTATLTEVATLDEKISLGDQA